MNNSRFLCLLGNTDPIAVQQEIKRLKRECDNLERWMINSLNHSSNATNGDVKNWRQELFDNKSKISALENLLKE